MDMTHHDDQNHDTNRTPPPLYFLYFGQAPSEIPRNITHVTIDPSTTKIQDYAFLDCHFLAQVQFHDQLQEIGDSAFQRCRSLTTAKIPSSVKAIGQLAFSECSSLLEVQLSEGLTTISYLTFGWCEILPSIFIPKSIESIQMEAFIGCSELVTVTIEEGSRLVSIGSHGFSNCLSLVTMILPSSLVTLGEGVFNYCLSLTHITLSNKLNAIEHNAFSWCKSLRHIFIPDSVQTVGNSAFFNCTALKDVSLCDGLISIQRRAFHSCTSLLRIHVPDSVSFIGDETFYKCQALVDVQLPSHLATIGDKVFWNCASLKSLKIPQSLGCIGNEAFFYCLSLVEINFPEQLRTIGTLAFANCESLSAIVLPSSLTMIGSRAFCRCTSLLCVEFLPASAMMERVTVGEHCFGECNSLVTLSIPSSSIWESTALTGCDALLLKDVRFGLQSELIQQKMNENLLALKRRFDELPVHQVCYHSSQLGAEDLNRVLHNTYCTAEPPQEGHGWQDYFGMTPFHVLVTSANPTVEMLNCLLDKCCSAIHCLIQRDGQGLTMMDYLLISRSPKVAPLIQVVLHRGLLRQLSNWGLERWSTFVSLGIESTSFDNDAKHLRMQSILHLVGYYLRVEMTSLVELALWKQRIQQVVSQYQGSQYMPGDDDGGDDDDGDVEEHRSSARWHCGVEVVLQHVIGYLWDDKSTAEESRTFACAATAVSVYPLLSLEKLEDTLYSRR